MFEGVTIALIVLFAAVFLAVLATANLVRFDDPIRRRLAGEVPRPPDRARGGNAVLRRKDMVRRAGQGFRAHLAQAGIVDPWAGQAYVITQVVLGLGAPAMVIFFAFDYLDALAAWHLAR